MYFIKHQKIIYSIVSLSKNHLCLNLSSADISMQEIVQ